MSKKIIKQCEHCYKEFSTNVPNKKYCNQYCSNKAKQKRQEEKKRLKEHRVLQAKIDAKDLVSITEINVVGHQKVIDTEIPIIEGGFGEGKRCLTDKAIAEIHNTEVRSIRQTIERNINRFKESVDYIDLKQITTSDVFQELDFTKAQIGNSKHIYLLSERGYAKLIKIMDTDLAWEIHDELIDRYFAMRHELNGATTPKLTVKQELATIIVLGGSEGIKAAKQLAEIEAEEAKCKAMEDRNKMIGATTAVEMIKDVLGLHDLTTGLFNKWLAEDRKLGTYETPIGEKKRRFEPNEDFFNWVALKGYAFTGKTRCGKKTNVQYSTAMVERIVDYHAGSLIKFVRINTAINRKDEHGIMA